MSLRHLLKDINNLGIYPDTFISMGRNNPHNEFTDMDGMIIGKYPVMECNAVMMEYYAGRTLTIESNKHLLMIGHVTMELQIILKHGKRVCKIFIGHSKNINLSMLGVSIVYNKYRIRSSKNLEKYVSEWLDMN